MSRAMNLSLPESEVLTACEKHGIRVSAVEDLHSGGTHLVCVTTEGADKARTLFVKSTITGPVRRYAFLRSNPSSQR